MRFTGQLANPELHRYYVTGSLEQKLVNPALQKMLSKIKNGGMNEFLNDKDLGNFSNGMCESFKSDKYINDDGSLTVAGNDIVSSGKAWRGLQGAFYMTVLEYNGSAYLLDAELAGSKKDQKETVEFQKTKPAIAFPDSLYSGAESSEFKSITTDENWAYCKVQPVNATVKFSFDYEEEYCETKVSWSVGQKEKKSSFLTTEESKFAIVKRHSAMELLKEREEEEAVFKFSDKDRKSIQIAVSDPKLIADKSWLASFFAGGSFTFEGIQISSGKGAGNIEDVRLYISSDDDKTASVLLNEYLLNKAEESYLGYEETGRLVTVFQDLFTSPSPDGEVPACPAIMNKTKEIYDELVEYAKAVSKSNPRAYLHLQAYIDLSPADTIKPYIEKRKTVNLTNQKLSFDDLVTEVFGNERNVKSIFIFSKYTASNGRNARAVKLFAESAARKFGAKTTVITTNEAVRPSTNKEYAESDKAWFSKLEKSVSIRKEKLDDIKTIHDRYYKVVRNDSRVEWWVLTGELDSLRFENDRPRIREDIQSCTEGTVKEMTFSKIMQSGVPDAVIKLMEVK